MKSEELKTILNRGNTEEKYDAFKDLDSKFITIEIFSILCGLLKDEDSEVRFFALYHIIDKFESFLSKIEGNLVNDFYNLLFDESALVLDRSIWALSIIGDNAIDKLYQEYQAGSLYVKKQISYAVGRGNFSERSQERIEILLSGINSSDNDLSYISMCELMYNTPLVATQSNPWDSIYNSKTTINEIYTNVLQIARKLSKTSNIKYHESSNYYIKLIENYIKDSDLT